MVVKVSLPKVYYMPCIGLMDLVTGTLKGYDQLMNLVLDDVKESMRGKNTLQLFHGYSLTVFR